MNIEIKKINNKMSELKRAKRYYTECRNNSKVQDIEHELNTLRRELYRIKKENKENEKED